MDCFIKGQSVNEYSEITHHLGVIDYAPSVNELLDFGEGGGHGYHTEHPMMYFLVLTFLLINIDFYKFSRDFEGTKKSKEQKLILQFVVYSSSMYLQKYFNYDVVTGKEVCLNPKGNI